ncbi:MAG TPA: helix-turn-helix transcriptional regulator, partial [Streptosporangiaceae bacterium]|nr:helix-turn-helix transcriptional regulator [Streptosporangiaceae bacterium]
MMVSTDFTLDFSINFVNLFALWYPDFTGSRWAATMGGPGSTDLERSMMSESAFEPARLRLARELKEWSQSDLAAQVSVTAAALGQYEYGATRPSPQTLAKLSHALDVPAEFFELPVVETHDGFFRSTRRTPVAHRRHARALAHIAHDLA